MYKKSGLIIGFLIIIIAVVIFLIASGSDSKKDSGKTTEINNVTSTTGYAETEQPVNSQQPVVSNTSTNIIDIDEDTLPLPVKTTQMGYVQTKKIVLIDNELYYSLGLLVGDDNMQLRYMVSKTGYDFMDVGSKCSVDLACYTTENGASYYLITGCNSVE